MKEQEICLAALNKYGNTSQITMVLEEMSELQNELCKSLRGRTTPNKIAEEIADVEIMLEQMKLLFDVQDIVDECKVFKLKRLRAMIGVIE